MRAETALLFAGTAMFASGLVMFYSVGRNPDDPVLELVRNAGTFAGIAGIGVALAGVLLYLIGKNEPPVAGGLGA